MAAQDVSQPPAAVVVAPPPQPAHPHVTQNFSSAPPASNNASFVEAIDRKARSYLKMLERGLNFSTSSPSPKDEDPSAMTIEFLRVRLQAQRAEYKAEKQRAQHLARKVLELERRLKLEVGSGKSAAMTSMDNPCDGSSCKQCRRHSGERIIDRKSIDLHLLKRGIPIRHSPVSESRIAYPPYFPYRSALHDPSSSTSATRLQINPLPNQRYTRASTVCGDDSNIITEC